MNLRVIAVVLVSCLGSYIALFAQASAASEYAAQDATGEVFVEYRGPLTAGAFQDITLRFRLGQTIESGGMLFVNGAQFGGVRLQNFDPGAANYVEPDDRRLTTSRTSLAIGPGMRQALLAFVVADEALQVGEEVEFSLRNLQIPTNSGDYRLQVYFSVDGTERWFALASEIVPVEAGPLHKIEIIAPSRLGRGQSANVEVVLQDKFGNPTSQSLPSLDVIQDGNFLRQFEPVDAVSTIQGIQFNSPGKHLVEVRTGGGGTRGVSNPIVVQSGDRQVLWTDMHKSAVNFAETLVPWINQKPVEEGGARLILSQNNAADGWRALPPEQVALPFAPVDVRSVDARKLKQVEMVSGGSVFEWYANRFFKVGYRLGVTGTSNTPLVAMPTDSGLTGVVVGGGQTVNVGLNQRSTYATTGNKMVVQATVNGALPGRRISRSQSRSVSGWVQGTAGIERIDLIKNGKLIDSINVAGDASSQTLKVTLHSSSAPLGSEVDYPRNGREWIGFMKTGQSVIAEVSSPGFRNTTRQAIAANGPSRVDFITWTHGGRSSFQVTLADGTEDEVIELNFKAGHEDMDLRPAYRDPQPIAAARQMIPWLDLANGPITRTVKVGQYADEIRLERVNPNPPDFVDFSFSDISPQSETDYYYIRVHQMDDHSAWTSPVFVGGFDAP